MDSEEPIAIQAGDGGYVIISADTTSGVFIQSQDSPSIIVSQMGVAGKSPARAVGFSLPGRPLAAPNSLLLWAVERQDTFTDAVAVCKVPATASVTLTFLKNSVVVGTLVFNAGSFAGVVTFQDPAVAKGALFEIQGPGVMDATLSGIGLTLVGTSGE